MNRQRSHEGHGERYRPRQTFNGLRFLQNWLSKDVFRKALIQSISRDAVFHGKLFSRKRLSLEDKSVHPLRLANV
jgi:hypothetical protein